MTNTTNKNCLFGNKPDSALCHVFCIFCAMLIGLCKQTVCAGIQKASNGITISVDYDGATANEIQEAVVDRLVAALQRSSSIGLIESTAVEGSCQVTAYTSSRKPFVNGGEMKILRKLDPVAKSLPASAGGIRLAHSPSRHANGLIVLQSNGNDELTNELASMHALFFPLISDLRSVEKVMTLECSGISNEVVVRCDTNRLRAHGLNTQSLIRQIKTSTTGSTIDESRLDRPPAVDLRSRAGDSRDLQADEKSPKTLVDTFARFPIQVNDGGTAKTISLAELGEIRMESSSGAWINGNSAFVIRVELNSSSTVLRKKISGIVEQFASVNSRVGTAQVFWLDDMAAGNAISVDLDSNEDVTKILDAVDSGFRDGLPGVTTIAMIDHELGPESQATILLFAPSGTELDLPMVCRICRNLNVPSALMIPRELVGTNSQLEALAPIEFLLACDDLSQLEKWVNDVIRNVDRDIRFAWSASQPAVRVSPGIKYKVDEERAKQFGLELRDVFRELNDSMQERSVAMNLQLGVFEISVVIEKSDFDIGGISELMIDASGVTVQLGDLVSFERTIDHSLIRKANGLFAANVVAYPKSDKDKHQLAREIKENALETAKSLGIGSAKYWQVLD